MSERSHNQERPSLPRRGRLAALPSGTRPDPQRDARGRVVGSQAARELAQGSGWKELTTDLAGRQLEGEAPVLGRQCQRLYRALLRSLPSDGPPVRVLVAAQARSAILSARFATKAAELGLDTDEGRAALDMSVKLDQRAERLAISSADLATKLATAHRRGAPSAPWLIDAIEPEAPAGSPAPTPATACVSASGPAGAPDPATRLVAPSSEFQGAPIPGDLATPTTTDDGSTEP